MPATFGGEVRTDDQLKIVRADGDDVAFRLHSGVTNTFPLVVHGPANADLVPILQQLGYDKHGVGTPLLYKLKKVAYHTQEMAQQNIFIL